MRSNTTASLFVGIILLTLLALWVDFSSSVGFGGLQRNVSTRLGLDLVGGAQVVLQTQPVAGQPITSDQLNQVRSIIENRVNGSGVSEPLVQTQGSDRILVELPQVQNADQVISTLQQTGFLEWIDSGSTQLAPDTIVRTTAGGPAASTTPTSTATLTGTTAVSATATLTGTSAVSTTATPAPTATTVYTTIITGKDLDPSGVSLQFDQAGAAQVGWKLKGDAAKVMANFTASHIGKYMPIVLDKKVIASPVIQSAIPDGNGVISHLGTLADAQNLTVILKYGSLPVQVTVVQQNVVGATLGQDSVNKSLLAGVIGLVLVAFFMIFYYRLPGVIAVLALLIYTALTFAVFKLVPVTLTLAGLAGFILSIGMAVDANVLIFARLKDELRKGKTIGAAVTDGFRNAWPSIRDSNISTMITCAILYWFGSTFGASTLRGFALTLGLGVIISMFSAVFVTRVFLNLILNLPFAQNKNMYGGDVSPHNRKADATA